MSISRTVFGIAATAALSAALVACSPPNENDSPVERSHEIMTTSQSPSTTSSTSTSSEATTTPAAPVEENVEITVSPAALVDGEQVTFDITGLDPEGGYYAAICAAAAAPGNPVPVCTGETADFTSQAWLSNSQPGATTEIAEDGTATVELQATATGEGLDCTVQECVAKVFGDHTEGFRDVAQTPVTFAAA
ncbi:thiamine biosynthesis protein x [Corynebacterium suranareeae]|uniref:Thiamine biosynthesis protein x n=1 Tax=Corynebacterium suranareeae TaxID=2506452 RepID=A0A160PRE7_9CORY|nr:thiamine biosynthesis protein [Corynebacterium suranareeae]BAU96659.1 thiamine biosynthesis protein x [Corynebacterium suranareeae]